MAADTHDIFGLPQIGGRAGQAELHRQRALAMPHRPDIGVDPGGEGLHLRARGRSIGCPFGFHVAAIEEQTSRAILRHIGRPEACRQQAQTPLAPQVDLPKPIPRRIPALQKECVALRRRENVRHAPCVDDDPGRRREAGNGGVSGNGGGGGKPGREGEEGEQCGVSRHRAISNQDGNLVTGAFGGGKTLDIKRALRRIRVRKRSVRDSKAPGRSRLLSGPPAICFA